MAASCTDDGAYPPALPLAVSALSGEDLSLPDDDCSCYFYGFHVWKSGEQW